jgi:hypothetical protein
MNISEISSAVDSRTIKDIVREALDDAEMIEYGQTSYSIPHMLETAMRLSGAPMWMVQEVYKRKINALSN